MTTKDLVIENAGEKINVQYSYKGLIKFDEWSKVAVTLQTIKDDIINMPFTDVSAAYYGNLFGYGTGNYVINLSTYGFMEDETGTVPGVATSAIQNSMQNEWLCVEHKRDKLLSNRRDGWGKSPD